MDQNVLIPDSYDTNPTESAYMKKKLSELFF